MSQPPRSDAPDLPEKIRELFARERDVEIAKERLRLAEDVRQRTRDELAPWLEERRTYAAPAGDEVLEVRWATVQGFERFSLKAMREAGKRLPAYLQAFVTPGEPFTRWTLNRKPRVEEAA